MKFKRTLFISILLIAIALCILYRKGVFINPRHINEQAKSKQLIEESEINNGDLIFQTSLSDQSKAIQAATHSQYSHCGLICKEGDDFFVLEAVQPVKRTPLDKWIARGQNQKFVIKRLRNANAILTPAALQKMKRIGESFVGKNYDLAFEWTDENIYCSELIWKIYQRATGLEVGKLQKLSDFDLASKMVRAKIQERYAGKIPLNEIVISPASIFDSELLTTVKEN